MHIEHTQNVCSAAKQRRQKFWEPRQCWLPPQLGWTTWHFGPWRLHLAQLDVCRPHLKDSLQSGRPRLRQMWQNWPSHEKCSPFNLDPESTVLGEEFEPSLWWYAAPCILEVRSRNTLFSAARPRSACEFPPEFQQRLFIFFVRIVFGQWWIHSQK